MVVLGEGGGFDERGTSDKGWRKILVKYFGKLFGFEFVPGGILKTRRTLFHFRLVAGGTHKTHLNIVNFEFVLGGTGKNHLFSSKFTPINSGKILFKPRLHSIKIVPGVPRPDPKWEGGQWLQG